MGRITNYPISACIEQGHTLRRFPTLVSILFLATSAGVIAASCAIATPVPELPASTSWIGNTYGFGNDTWVPINITAIAAAPDGRVFTDTPWDESGAEVSLFQNGRVLGNAGNTHDWGSGGGNAIALNKRYLFIATTVGNEDGHLSKLGVWPPAGRQWYGVSRRALDDPKTIVSFRPNLAASDDPHAKPYAGFLMINDSPVDSQQDVGGLAASDASLYVANTARDRIEVYDAESMRQKGKWDARQPGRIALAKDGSLWAVIDSLGARPRIAHYTAAGVVIADAPALQRDTQPQDLALDARGRLLVADNGPRQQVLIFTFDAGAYRESATLGERGGIFAGVPGKPGPQRFNGLTGVAADAAGNIYVSTNGVGVHSDGPGAGLGGTLEGYGPDGNRLWQVQGLLFVDGAWMDPARPNSVYTGNKRFELDLTKPPGHQWTYAGFLSGRFKYPEDPVFHVDQWPGLPIARKLDGRTFLYLTDMYSDHLKIYRFDPKRNGELATPSVLVAGRTQDVVKIPNRPANGEWIWHDDNGNGRFESNEFEVNSSGMQFAGGWGWWVDATGDIWRTTDTKGIYRLRYGGVDKLGNPVYSYANMMVYAMPAPFTELRRAVYDAASDTMYLTGYTASEPFDPALWKEAGRRLVRYDHWSTKLRQRYSISLPWDTGQKPFAGTTVGVIVEGNYIFTVEPAANVHVFDNATGHELGVIRPGPEVGRTSGMVDVPNGVTAFRQADGEYLVFVEEDARGKVIMYRWKP
jgi:hypothetical protein